MKATGHHVSFHLVAKGHLTNFCKRTLQLSDVIDNGFARCICREYVAAVIIGFKRCNS